MRKKRYRPEEILSRMREADVLMRTPKVEYCKLLQTPPRRSPPEKEVLCAAISPPAVAFVHLVSKP